MSKKITPAELATRWGITHIVDADDHQVWKETFMALGTATFHLDRKEAEIEKLLGSPLVQWLLDNFAGLSNAKGVGDYIEDHHENGKTPSIMNSLKRLGAGKSDLVKKLEREIQTFDFEKTGDYYKYPAENI